MRAFLRPFSEPRNRLSLPAACRDLAAYAMKLDLKCSVSLSPSSTSSAARNLVANHFSSPCGFSLTAFYSSPGLGLLQRIGISGSGSLRRTTTILTEQS